MPDVDASGIEVISAIDERRRSAATKALDMSLNELADMYEAEPQELIIRPEYQRLFRWPLEKQSQFIESLLLEMPVPPIFVIELEEGKWELIDGLQRISSYLHFRGKLNDPVREIVPGTSLTLRGCDIVKELNGKTHDTLPAALQYRLKRAFLRVEIVRKETQQRFRYYMFKRLNTGGEPLSEQEVRNCTIRLLGIEFNQFITTLAQTSDAFTKCIDALSEAEHAKMGDIALVLRFFAFKNHLAEFSHDIDPFLSDYMERVTDRTAPNTIPFDYDAERVLFERVFVTLSKALGENTCRRWDNKYVGGFSMHHFEAFAVGLGCVADRVDLSNMHQQRAIAETLTEIKQNAEFKTMTQGGGKNSRGLYEKKIAFVADRVSAVL